MRFLQLFLRSLYYAVLSDSNVNKNRSFGSAVELYVSWAWEADITEYCAIYSTRLLSVVHVFKF